MLQTYCFSLHSQPKGFLFSGYIWLPDGRSVSKLSSRLTEVKIPNPFGSLMILLSEDANDLTQSWAFGTWENKTNANSVSF